MPKARRELLPGFEVQFMRGERPDLHQVSPGSEKPHIMPADFVQAERDFAAAEQAVAGYDYAAAELLLRELRERLNKLATKPPKAFRHRLEKALGWTGVMANMGYRPARVFALASALGEFAGGLLFALGLITPIAAFVLVAQSVVIIGAAHWRKGFFNRDGGFEFPLALLIGVVAILIAGA